MHSRYPRTSCWWLAAFASSSWSHITAVALVPHPGKAECSPCNWVWLYNARCWRHDHTTALGPARRPPSSECHPPTHAYGPAVPKPSLVPPTSASALPNPEHVVSTVVHTMMTGTSVLRNLSLNPSNNQGDLHPKPLINGNSHNPPWPRRMSTRHPTPRNQ